MKYNLLVCVVHEKMFNFANILIMLLFLSDVIKKFHPLPDAFESVLASLLKAVEVIPRENLLKFIMVPAEVNENLANSPKISSPLDLLTAILVSDIQHLQLCAHLILIK